MQKLHFLDTDFDAKLANLLAFDASIDEQVGHVVDGVIAAVKEQGDEALFNYTVTFDRRKLLNIDDLVVSSQMIASAFNEISLAQRQALEAAADRIQTYHQKQLQSSWQYQDDYGNLLGQKLTPLERVGIYVPGGKASYPSSVLMNAIPAKVAGVNEIVMVVPTPDDIINPMVLAAAKVAGVDKVFSIGGAQAIAALAFGTKLVPKVDKIVGPGNIFVATAKQKVFGQVGLDMIAGPSEILIVCDGKTPVDWIVMDLFSQAEHDENAQAILISTDEVFLQNVEEAIPKLLKTMPRADIIAASLRDRGALIQVENLDQAVDLINKIAPEHLELSVDEPEVLVDKIKHAGAIFMGRYTAEALGDYCAGPNHVLPTSGTARFSSPLGVYDFQKRTSLIQCTQTGADQLADIASVLAKSESLNAHAESALKRK